MGQLVLPHPACFQRIITMGNSRIGILHRLYQRIDDLAGNASSLYARNLYAFIDLMIDKEKKGALAIDWDDDVIKGTLVAKSGKLVHPMLAPKKGGKK